MLRIDSYQNEVEQRVIQRRQKDLQTSQAHSTETWYCHGFHSAFAKIHRRNDGSLRAPLQKLDGSRGPQNDRLWGLVSDLTMQKSLPKTPQRIFVGPEVAVAPCSLVREGDVLVGVGRVAGRCEDVLLVTRRSEGQFYEIVGQAITLNGHRLIKQPSGTTKSSDCGCAIVKPELTNEDVVVLFAQDMAKDESFDAMAKFQRLRTKVSLSSRASLRLTRFRAYMYSDPGPEDISDLSDQET